MSVLLITLLIAAGPTPGTAVALGESTTGLVGGDRSVSSVASDGRQFLMVWTDNRFERHQARWSLVSENGVLRDPNGLLLGEGFGLVAFGGRRCSDGLVCAGVCVNATCQLADGGVSTPNRYLIARMVGRDVALQVVLPTGELVSAETPMLSNVDDGVSYVQGVNLVGTSTGFVLVWSTSNGQLKMIRMSLTGLQLDAAPVILATGASGEFATAASLTNVMIAYTKRVAAQSDLHVLELNGLNTTTIDSNVGQNIALGVAFVQGTWLVKWVNGTLRWHVITSESPLVVGPLGQTSGAGAYYGGAVAADLSDFVVASVPIGVELFRIDKNGTFIDGGTCLSGPSWVNTDPSLTFAQDTQTWWVIANARLISTSDISAQRLDATATPVDPSHFVIEGNVTQRHAALASNDKAFFAAWQESTPEGEVVMGVNLARDGTALDVAPTRLSPRSPVSLGPRVAVVWSGVRFAVAWVETPIREGLTQLHLRAIDGPEVAVGAQVNADAPVLVASDAGVLLAWVQRATNDRVFVQRFDAQLQAIDGPQVVGTSTTIGDLRVGVDPAGYVVTYSETPGAFRGVRLSSTAQVLSVDGGVALTSVRSYGDEIALSYVGAEYVLTFAQSGVLHTAQLDPATLRVHDEVTTTQAFVKTVQLERWPGRVGAVAVWSTVFGEVWLARVTPAGLADEQPIVAMMPSESPFAVNAASALVAYGVEDAVVDNARLRVRPLVGLAVGAPCRADFDCASGVCVDQCLVAVPNSVADAGPVEVDGGEADAGLVDGSHGYRVGCGCAAVDPIVTTMCLALIVAQRRSRRGA